MTEFKVYGIRKSYLTNLGNKDGSGMTTQIGRMILSNSANHYRAKRFGSGHHGQFVLPVKVHTFEVAMTCEGCSNAAKRVLGKLGDKVSNVDIDLENKKVVVTSSMSAEELKETLKKTGKDVEHLGTV